MTACYSWTRYSHNKKADERYRKLERKAVALIEGWDEDEDEEMGCGGEIECGREMDVEVEGGGVFMDGNLGKEIK